MENFKFNPKAYIFKGEGMKRTVCGIMLMFLLMAMFPIALNIKSTKAEWTGTVYIRADGSIDPPDAPIVTYDNVTYTLIGNITITADATGIVIEKDNVLLDGAGFTLMGVYIGGDIGLEAGISIGYYGGYRKNVTIENFNIIGFDRGIFLFYSHNVNIHHNNITYCGIGVDMHVGCSFIRIYGNHFKNNHYAGIGIGKSSNSIIYRNRIYGCFFGIVEHGSGSFNFTFIENQIINAYMGIELFGSTNHLFRDNNITTSKYGFGFSVTWGWNFSQFMHDIDTSNTINGKPIYYLINKENLVISNATYPNIGFLALIHSRNITIEGLEFKGNGQGILLANVSVSTIINNVITNNRVGLMLCGSINNRITINSLESNMYGVELWNASNNIIFHNNFNNLHQIASYTSNYANFWDNGYPSGGNYWSDYSGVDLYSGPYQNETGGDGIGDTPYVIDENNVDHYPLMKPWTPKPSVINATVDIQPQALNLRSKGKWITAYIELPESYDVSNINVSTIMLNSTISIDLEAPVEIGDYDNDTIPDLMVKFDRQQVIKYIMSNVDLSRLYEERFMTITLTVTGKLNDGTPFQGSDTIKIILPMPRCWRLLAKLGVYPF